MRLRSLEAIKTVVFDLDGTLLDTKRRHYACYRDLLVDSGLHVLSMGAYWRLKRRACPPRDILKRTGASQSDLFFEKGWRAAIESPRYLRLDKLQPGTRRLLNTLRRQGVRTTIATMRANRDRTLTQCRQLGLEAAVDRIVVCSQADGGRAKGLATRRALGQCDAETTLWVGDTEADVDAAHALGCRVVLVSCGIRTSAHLRRLRAGPVVFAPSAILDWLS